VPITQHMPDEVNCWRNIAAFDVNFDPNLALAEVQGSSGGLKGSFSLACQKSLEGFLVGLQVLRELGIYHDHSHWGLIAASQAERLFEPFGFIPHPGAGVKYVPYRPHLLSPFQVPACRVKIAVKNERLAHTQATLSLGDRSAGGRF